MTDKQLQTAHYVFTNEGEQWRLVKFQYNNIQVVRSCGETHSFSSEDDAQDLVRRRSVSALLAYYHECMAKQVVA